MAENGVSLGFLQRLSLGLKGVGFLVKMGWAFVWQEEMFKGDYLRNAKINTLGGEMCKYVNMLGNALTGFKRSDKDFQACVNVYPGDAACRVGSSPHTKWHEQSANALVDLMLLSDEMDKAIRGKSFVSAQQDAWFSFWAGLLSLSS